MRCKKGFFRIGVATIILTLMFPFLSAQDRIGKELQKDFNVNANTGLSIENKYGNIDIRNWDKNSIDVLVQVKLFDISDSKAEELLRDITLRYNQEGNKHVFVTDFDDGFSKSLMRINNGNKKFEVNYIVNMPHTVPVYVSNKYGDVFIDRLSSGSTIEVKYGNLKANNISSVSKDNMAHIILGYSDADIEECSWLKLSMKYSKMRIEESKALIVMSKYSKLYLERGSSIVAESKYDTYEIGTLANFVAEAGYGNFRFKSIGKKLQVETSYTDVKIGYMPASFESIKINNRYGGYSIGIEENASYKIKGYAKYGNIVYPENSRLNSFKENNELKIEGMVGKSENTAAKVSIDTKYGTIKLR